MNTASTVRPFRRGQMLGKYRLEARIAEGGFAVVYRAHDTIEGVPVALKIPHEHLMTRAALEDVRKEARLTARLSHPNILSIKNASMIEGRLVIAYPLAEQSLATRLRTRLAARTALSYSEQLIAAVAYAHEERVMHLDIKPDNILLFPDDHICLGDFGIAKVALRTRTIYGSGAGTIGYIAPEQALGKPSFRSDVFAIGLVMHRMFAGTLPEWPFEWPPPGIERLRRKVHPKLIEIIHRSIQVDQKKRYRDAVQLQAAFERLGSRALSPARSRSSRGRRRDEVDWKAIRLREFRRRFGKTLAVRGECGRCGGLVAETFCHCPWCGKEQRVYKGPVPGSRRCPRCGRGMKGDWRFCAFCYGAGLTPTTTRSLSDRRYVARCSNPACDRRDLMPFMRYCPWCRRKVRRTWKVPGSEARCPRCRWGVVKEFWGFCAWCGRKQGDR